jgi:spore maturation protein CgeB
MLRNLRLAYFAHTLRSDWNNGNAHFLRGLMRSLGELGHEVTIFEPRDGWSVANLRQEPAGGRSLEQFAEIYPELRIRPYDGLDDFASAELQDADVVIVHEWNPPELAHALLRLRDDLDFRLLFHDTHHRASSSPEQMRLFGLDRFDGVLAFGEALRTIYRVRFGFERVWTLHEAADTSVFRPLPAMSKQTHVLWIGNWGDDERSREISEFLLCPASQLPGRRFLIHGVRYPDQALAALHKAGVEYGGYLANLDAPAAYAAARLTVHIPRQQYATAMTGIPTIRVFEALACGIPLLSAPWQDTEQLFREGDYVTVRNEAEVRRAIENLLDDPAAAQAQAQRGLETVLARHTCGHRAMQLSLICEEVLS